MRKYLVVLVAALALVAFTMPTPAAAADIKASGFFRSYAIMSNFHDGGGGPSLRTSDEEQTNSYVASRFRVKWQFGMENVKVVWYLESDFKWGDQSGSTPSGSGGASRNTGGALGADRVQTETKQINVWFKIPNTSLSATAGIHTVKDSYSGIFSAGNDMAGLTFRGKYEPVKYRLVWAKLYENTRHHSDDATLYIAEVKFAPTKDSKLGINLYFLQDDQGKDGPSNLSFKRFDSTPGSFDGQVFNSESKLRLYMPGIDGSIKAGPVKLSGFFFYQTGEFEATAPGDSDIDISGFAVDLRGDFKVGPGKAFIEGLYISGDDNINDDDYESIITLGEYQSGAPVGPGGYNGFTRTGMVLLLPNPKMATVSQCIIGCSGDEFGDSMSNSGRGLWIIAAGYGQKFTDRVSGNFRIGHMEATELYDYDKAAGRDEDMGTEVNATVNIKIQKGLDLSLVGAYLFLGDFVRDVDSADPFTNPNLDTFEDAWATYARLAVKF
ncbi:MAG: hypothetical protein HKM86_11530 [Deltaproteobacteria bacterium]|nr:hypothetical protein [Deltaproteobacteria bacterium]